MGHRNTRILKPGASDLSKLLGERSMALVSEAASTDAATSPYRFECRALRRAWASLSHRERGKVRRQLEPQRSRKKINATSRLLYQRGPKGHRAARNRWAAYIRMSNRYMAEINRGNIVWTDGVLMGFKPELELLVRLVCCADNRIGSVDHTERVDVISALNRQRAKCDKFVEAYGGCFKPVGDLTLTERFNKHLEHLKGTGVVFIDEPFFPGDRK